MKMLKGLSAFISFMIIFSTSAYASSISLQTPNVEREVETIEVTNLEIEGMIKAYDKELHAEVFSSNEVDAMSYGDFDNSYEVIDYSVEIDETIDDKYENDKVSALASNTDIVAHGLMADGELIPGQTATFAFYLTNDGSTNLTNVEYSIKINNQIVGTITIDDVLLANTQYRIGFRLNGLSEGTYNILVHVDPNNKILENNKANNITSAYFVVQNGLPDLTVKIISPTSPTLPGVEEGSASQQFKFRIDNIGNGYSPANVFVQIFADDTPLQSFYLEKGIAPNRGSDGEFNLFFAAYKPTEIKIVIDPSNRITESNKNNNSHARTYSPAFCLHKWQPNTKVTGDVGVQVLDTAFFGNVDMSFYQDNLAAWNGITDNLGVERATVTSSEELMSGYNVLVRGRISPGNYQNILAETVILGSSNPYARIDLFTDVMGNRAKSQNVRTFVHELGHAFNLGHPNETEACSYKSIMYQSSNGRASNEITLHDQYNIYKLHDNAKKILSSELPENEILTEYQINTVNAIDIFSLAELEELAEYVVKGRILDDGENVHTKLSQYTKTGFEISDVYKGELDVGDIIYIGEDYFKEYIEGVETSFYYDGYKESIPGKEYIFFLVKKPDFDVYGLAYSSLSKYSPESSVQLKANLLSPCCDNTVFTEENYSNIEQEVLLKYQ